MMRAFLISSEVILISSVKVPDPSPFSFVTAATFPVVSLAFAAAFSAFFSFTRAAERGLPEIVAEPPAFPVLSADEAFVLKIFPSNEARPFAFPFLTK